MSPVLSKRDFANCVPSRIEKTWETFNSLKDEIIAIAPKSLRSTVIQTEDCAYVPHYWNQAGPTQPKEKYKEVMWVGFAHKKFLRKIQSKRGKRGKGKRGNPRYGVQLQFGINRTEIVFNGIWLDGGVNTINARRAAETNLKRNFTSFKRILRRLPSTYYLYAARKYEPGNPILMNRRVHRMSDNRLLDFLNYLGVRDVNIEIGEDITRDDALSLSRRGELEKYIVENFSRLLPLYSLMIADLKDPVPSNPNTKSSKPRESDVRLAEGEIRKMLSRPFEPFDARTKTLSVSKRVARDEAFGRIVSELYGGACAVCGSKWVVKKRSEVEGAHIIPVHKYGSDDLRNGLALCRFHHWAFDLGVFSLSDNLEIMVSQRVGEFTSTPKTMQKLSRRKLSAPISEGASPSQTAIQWHRKNIFIV